MLQLYLCTLVWIVVSVNTCEVVTASQLALNKKKLQLNTLYKIHFVLVF